MDRQSVKIDLIHSLTEFQDKSDLKKFQGLKVHLERSFELNAGQKKEQGSRLEKYESGEIRFYPWGTIKDKI